MGIGFKGGLAAFVKGAEQGADRQRAIEEQKRNAAWLESQRKLTTAQQARDEDTRQKMTQVGKDRTDAVPQAGPGREMANGTEAPMPPMQVARKATPEETWSDLAAVQRGAGNIEGALNSMQTATTYADTQRKKFEIDLADAVAKGDPERITQVINGVGKNRVTGPVSISPFERTLDGYGTVPTFNATFKVQDPNGKVVEQTLNSHDLKMRLEPYSAQLDTQLKGKEAKRKDEEGVAKNSYYNSFSRQKDALAANGGKAPSSARADHFDEKAWNDAFKVDKGSVTVTDENTGKAYESTDLRAAYMKTFNIARAGGTMAPTEAAEHATMTVGRLRAAAEKRVEQARASDKGSTLTLDKALRGLVKEAEDAEAKRPKPAPAPTAAAATGGITNPGNLRPPGASTGFAKYSTPEAGLQALDGNLKAYGAKGINTVSQIITRWAPPSENNTAAYVAAVSRRLGVNPNQPLNLNDPVVRQMLSTAITLHEHGPAKVFAGGLVPAKQRADALDDLDE